MKNYLYRYFMVTLGCLLLAVATDAFLIPFNLLSGGLSGYCVILYYLAGWPVSVTNILFNIPLFIAAYKLMSRDYFICGIFGTCVCSVFLQALSFLTAQYLVRDMILACMAGGILGGIGDAFIYRVGGNTGGIDIIGAIIQKHYTISIGTTAFLANVLMLAIGCYFFGIESTLYTLLSFFAGFKATNAFMEGFDYKKSLLIISPHYLGIGEEIIQFVGRGVTYLQAEGGYAHQKYPAVLVVAKLTQVAKIKSIVRHKDPYAFMIIQDARDVQGRGFTERNLNLKRPYELRTGWQEEDAEDAENAGIK